MKDRDNPAAIGRITALWAFSEAALGGILHGLRIPLTGIFVGGAAVLFITLIAYFADKKSVILKSTFIVIIVKGIVSPHTPLAAYIAVLLQGAIGRLIFINSKNYKISALLFGLIVLMLSGFQRLVIVTIVFGYSLWDSIDVYGDFVYQQFFPSQTGQVNLNLSYILIGIYVGLHLITGILVGILASRLPSWINNLYTEGSFEFSKVYNETDFNNLKVVNVRKHWWQKKSAPFFFFTALLMIILSYLFPELGRDRASEIAIMLIRAILIIFIWYKFLAPLLFKLFQMVLKSKRTAYTAEIENIIRSFPQLKVLVIQSWKISSQLKGFKRIKSFVTHAFVYLLMMENNPE